MTCACRALKKTLPSNIRHWVFLIHLGWETTLEKDPIQRPARLSPAYLSHTRASEEKHPNCQHRSSWLGCTEEHLSQQHGWNWAKRTGLWVARVLPASGTKGHLPGGAERDPAPLGTKGHYQEGRGEAGSLWDQGTLPGGAGGQCTPRSGLPSTGKQARLLSEKRPCPKTPSHRLSVTLFPVTAEKKLLPARRHAARPEGLPHRTFRNLPGQLQPVQHLPSGAGPPPPRLSSTQPRAQTVPRCLSLPLPTKKPL